MSSNGVIIWTLMIHKADPNFLAMKHNSCLCCNLHVIFEHLAVVFAPNLSVKKFFWKYPMLVLLTY